MKFASVIIGGDFDSLTHARGWGGVSSPQQITRLLRDWVEGDAAALDQLLPLVESELRALAGRYMRNERRAHTLQTTALINEACLKIMGQKDVHWRNRAHFFGVAAILMRRILLDHARGHGRGKRGGGEMRVSFSDASLMTEGRAAELIKLDEALNRLEQYNPRRARVVLLKFFGGLSIKEIAQVLDVAPSTVSSEWNLAKAWLREEMDDGE